MATKAELGAVLPLLDQHWEDAADLVDAIVDTIDNVRADKVTYAGVMQMDTKDPWYIGVGYYPGFKSAHKAIASHPAAGMAKAIAVVPVRSPKGLTLQLAALDAPPAPKGDWALVQEDARLYKLGWDGKQGTRKTYLDMMKKAS